MRESRDPLLFFRNVCIGIGIKILERARGGETCISGSRRGRTFLRLNGEKSISICTPLFYCSPLAQDVTPLRLLSPASLEDVRP